MSETDSFPEDFYEIKWVVTYGRREVIAEGTGNIIEFKVDDNCVSHAPKISADLITKRTWHRFSNIDDHFEMSMSQVLPPLEDKFL